MSETWTTADGVCTQQVVVDGYKCFFAGKEPYVTMQVNDNVGWEGHAYEDEATITFESPEDINVVIAMLVKARDRFFKG